MPVELPVTSTSGPGAPPPLPVAEVRERGPRPRRFKVLIGIVGVYLLAAAATVPVADAAPVHGWIALHLLLLGAATNAIVVFGRHFAQALLHSRGGSERAAGVRLAVLNAGVVAVLLGVSLPHPLLVGTGASLVVAAVLWHVGTLVLMDRAALLAGRLRVVVRYYVVAGCALAVGGVLGALLGTGSTPGPLTHDGLHLAHVHLNLLGWVGLAVLGTAFMLWPAALRTRMADDAPQVAKRALVLAAAALTATTVGLLADAAPLAAAGVLAYAAAVGWSLVPAVRIARVKPPTSVAAVSLAAAVGWLLVALVVDALALAQGGDAPLRALATLVPLLGVGFVAQVLVGALSFLVPVTVGGGPGGNRGLAALLDVWWPARAALTNAGALLLALPLPARWTALGWAAAVVGLGSFVVLLAVALLRPRPPVVAPPPRPGEPARPQSTPSFVPAVSVLTAVAVLGLVMTGGWPEGQQQRAVAAAAGTVEVVLDEVSVAPAVVTVARGQRLVLEVRNEGAMRHDLRVDGGPGTPVLDPGASATLDVGVVTGDLVAWCTVAGHRQAGMVLTIEVDDGSASAPPGAAQRSAGSTGPAWTPYDPALPPAPGGTTHDVTLDVVEADVEVADGVRQRMWTFGGTVPGPVLRGEVGDVFHVRLVNSGTLPHSVDFHASRVAPDRLMRSIEPGEELVYTFRAEHAGVWMYHCGTVPVLQHVAMGMYGAVVIDPPALPPVDRELVLVQSELYLGEGGGLPETGPMTAADYDLVAFNGYAGQYDRAPVDVAVGERVRVWVLDAGPSAPSAFHVVGTQFDTVYKEGAYLLRPGQGQGAAQVLDLAPAQGGFVEFTLPEPGRYPFVTHRLADAARGATGTLVAR